jgi:hypothetical protein
MKPSATRSRPVTDADLLRAAIRDSGKTNAEFARDVLTRDPRVIRRWLAGGKIPKAVRELLTTAGAPPQPRV